VGCHVISPALALLLLLPSLPLLNLVFSIFFICLLLFMPLCNILFLCPAGGAGSYHGVALLCGMMFAAYLSCALSLWQGGGHRRRRLVAARIVRYGWRTRWFYLTLVRRRVFYLSAACGGGALA